jgi:hypothetical protein
MNRTLDWQQRHAVVVARLAREREEIGRLAANILRPVRRVEDIGHRAGPLLRRLIPLWVPVAVFLLLRPRWTLHWAARLLHLYSRVRRVGRLIGY